MNWTWRLGSRTNIGAGRRGLLSRISIELGLMHSEDDLGNERPFV
jgi:hypothetical protein